MQINKNILSLKNEFDIFFFDSYGVLWNGSDFYNGVLETLEELILNKKIVIILSNATTLSSGAIKKYAEKGLIEGKHFHNMITSGEVLNNHLVNNKIEKVNNLKNNKNLKVYFFSISKSYPLRDENYNLIDEIEETKNIENADFVYITVPRFHKIEYLKHIENHPENKKYITAYSKDKNGEIDKWEITDISVFKEEIDNISKIILKNDLLVINPNPDFFANSKDIENNKSTMGNREGSVVNEFRKNGIKNIIEFGKPNKNIFEYTFQLLKENNINIENKNKIVMVGDNLSTDIFGANNCGIKSALCCNTGMMEKMNKSEIEILINNSGIKVDYFIESVY